MRVVLALAGIAMYLLPDLEPIQAQDVAPVRVTADNFVRAESDLYFGSSVKAAGGVGKVHHHREPMRIDTQSVIRANRDTLYSPGVFDLDAGPVTITLPEAAGRFRSMQVINEDHYIVGDVLYDAGAYTYDKQKVGTRYVLIALRTLVDPDNPDDIKQACALQDATIFEQPKGPGKFEVPAWDPASQKTIRQALLVLGETLPDSKQMFGRKDEVDPVRHFIGAAMAWGGNREQDAIYLNVTPAKNDGKTIHRLTVRNVPVGGFWSISVYNAKGYFEPNGRNAYTVNNITAKKNKDDSVTVQFGGDTDDAPNVLPIAPGWNYLVRLYRPRKEILDGTWTFPEAERVVRSVGEES